MFIDEMASHVSEVDTALLSNMSVTIHKTMRSVAGINVI